MPPKFSTHYVPDLGTRFTPGETVHVDQSSGQVIIIKDPAGDYEVTSCRPATEFNEDPPLLRVDLKRIDRDPWPPSPPSPWT